MSAAAPEAIRLERLNRLLREVWQFNSFYARKWREAGAKLPPLASVAELAFYPLTTREELLADQAATPPLGANLTGPPDSLKRFHRSSGTTRAPLLWADSVESWEWVMQCSQRLWQLAGVGPSDRILFLMPFGASSGPWIIHGGACRLGAACFPVGQTESAEQLYWLARFKPTVLAGKPATLEALALAAKSVFGDCTMGSTGHWPVPSGDSPDGTGRTSPANDDGLLRGAALLVPVGESPTGTGGSPVLPIFQTRSKSRGTPPLTFAVRKLILCGEHELSLRASLDHLWNAQSFNRYGLTEAGSVAAECTSHSGGLHLLDDEFIAESIEPGTARPVHDGEPGELVLTTLGRITRPIIRYRTGDLVRLVSDRQCACGRRGAMLLGGVVRLGHRTAQGKA